MKVSIPFLSSGSGRRPGRPTDRRNWALLLLGALVVVGISVVAFLVLATSHARDPRGTLVVHTAPEGARLTLDGRGAGQTPAVISVGAGEHVVAIGDERFLPADDRVQVAAGQAASPSIELWRRTPNVAALRPSFPGATLESVDFLDDGRVAVGEVLPPGQDHQIWVLDWNGTMRQLGPPDAAGPISLDPQWAADRLHRRRWFETGGSRSTESSHPRSGLRIDGQARDEGSESILALHPHSNPPENDVTESARRAMEAKDLTRIKFLSDPRVSSDGTRVAFVVTTLSDEKDEYLSNICLVGVDGGEPQRFTNGPKRDTAPRWSPDGRNLAFVSERESKKKGQLYVIPVGGGEPIRITDLVNGVSSPEWSPDGSRLAFLSRVGGWQEPENEEEKQKSKPPQVISVLK